jgi:hypothetical protein
MKLGTIGAIAQTIVLCSALPVHGAAAQETGPVAVPGRLFYGGVVGQGLISHCPGGALSVAVELEPGQAVFGVEASIARLCNEWNALAWAAHAGAVLTSGIHAPYVLAGVQQSTILALAYDGRMGRDDFALTGEAGYAYRRPNGGWQLWLGLRGILPVASRVHATNAPDLPSAAMTVRLLMR